MGAIKLPHASGNSMSIAAPATNPASDLTLTLPTTIGSADQYMKVDGSGNLGWVTPPTADGISEIDLYRLHTDFQGTSNPITSNWERFDSQTEGKLGTGMSESSGLFTFPSTGYYYVHFTVAGYRGASSAIYNITSYVRTTTAGSTSSGTHYNSSGRQSIYSESGNSAYSCTNTTIFKCSNTSNDKIFFGVDAESSVYIQGNTGSNFTYVVFTKLADL